MNFTEQYFRDAEKILIDLFTDIRPELMKFHGNVLFETKEDKSIVTHLDKELEVKIKDILRNYDSSVGFWGEEHGKEGNQKSFWLIDPIDGTESLVRGLSGCRHLVTFIDNNQPQYALAFRFTTEDLFTAIKGKTTEKNGQPVRLSNRPIDRSWVEFSVNMQLPDGYDIYKAVRPKLAGITVHRDFLEILEAGIEGIIVYKSAGQEWDYAPRALLIEGAGGHVANIGKEGYDFRDKSLLAATPEVFEALVEVIDKAIGSA
jgi:inositol-phosphate phosphatase/L-galactose 1-phosphate phosphatase/histidinol-phosphatase